MTAEVPFPEQGVLRVSDNPPRTPRLRPLDELGGSRFDDPKIQFVVRYCADTLRGCLVELLSRFRENLEASDRLAAIEGVEEAEEPQFSWVEALGDWLAGQRVGVCHAEPDHGVFLDVHDPVLHVELNKEKDVRAALRASGLDAPHQPAMVDDGTIRLRGPGRLITQAISRVLYEREPPVAGLVYKSRLDGSERCWAIYDRTPVRFEHVVDLTPSDPNHLAAVRSAAALFELELPSPWCPPPNDDAALG